MVLLGIPPLPDYQFTRVVRRAAETGRDRRADRRERASPSTSVPGCWCYSTATPVRPRATSGIYVYFGPVRPLLERWAATRGHLREITRIDITTEVDTLRGSQRRTTLSALCSL